MGPGGAPGGRGLGPPWAPPGPPGPQSKQAIYSQKFFLTELRSVKRVGLSEKPGPFDCFFWAPDGIYVGNPYNSMNFDKRRRRFDKRAPRYDRNFFCQKGCSGKKNLSNEILSGPRRPFDRKVVCGRTEPKTCAHSRDSFKNRPEAWRFPGVPAREEPCAWAPNQGCAEHHKNCYDSCGLLRGSSERNLEGQGLNLTTEKVHLLIPRRPIKADKNSRQYLVVLWQ